MTGLVAMHVLTDETGHVEHHLIGNARFCRKQRIELASERLSSAEQLHVALHIVLHKKGGLPAFASV